MIIIIIIILEITSYLCYSRISDLSCSEIKAQKEIFPDRESNRSP